MTIKNEVDVILLLLKPGQGPWCAAADMGFQEAQVERNKGHYEPRTQMPSISRVQCLPQGDMRSTDDGKVTGLFGYGSIDSFSHFRYFLYFNLYF